MSEEKCPECNDLYFLNCNKCSPAPLEASIGSTDAKNVSKKSEKIDVSPVEAERISDATINYMINHPWELGYGNREYVNALRQQQKDLSELKAANIKLYDKYMKAIGGLPR